MSPSTRPSACARRTALVAIGALLLAGSCSRDARDPVDRAARSIAAKRIDRTGKLLAGDAMAGRYYASPEADSTVARILERLRASGIRPVDRSDLLLDGRPASFVHDFSVTLHRLGRFLYLSAVYGGREHVAELGRDYMPLVYSRNDDIDTTVVRLDHDPLAAGAAAGSFTGRVVLVREGAWHGGPAPDDARLYRAAQALEARGAAAVLFEGTTAMLHLPAATYPTHLTPEQTAASRSVRGRTANLHADRMSQASQSQAWTVGQAPTLPAFLVRPSWAERLHDGDRILLRSQLEPEVSLGQNILVGFRGRSHPQEVVILGTHYDHTGINAVGDVLNGADDNASGVAALLEIAQALASVRNRLERSVLVVFFSAEREGLQGSEAFVQDLPRLVGTETRPIAMLALRAVGREGRPLWIVGGTGHPDLAALLERHDRSEQLWGDPLDLQPTHDESTMVARLEIVPSRGSDHLTFARDGVPSLLVTAGFDPEVHDQPDDDWPGIDADRIARVARLVLRAVIDLSQEGLPGPMTAPAGTR